MYSYAFLVLSTLYSVLRTNPKPYPLSTLYSVLRTLYYRATQVRATKSAGNVIG